MMSLRTREALGYHLSRLKGDAAMIAGASGAVFTTMLILIALHEEWSQIRFLAIACLCLASGLQAAALLVREIFRRAGKASESASLSRIPVKTALAGFAAATLLTGFLARIPLEAGVAWQSGQRHLDANDFEAAERSFSRYIELLPSSGAGYYGRGLANFRSGQMNAALADLKSAIQRQPRDWSSRVLLLRTLAKLGQKAEFEAELKAAEAIEPNVREFVSDVPNATKS